VSELLILWPLVAVTLLSPLPFGSVEPWAWSLLAVVTGLTLVVWCAVASVNRELVAMSARRYWLAALLFALAMAWAQLQGATWLPAGWHHPIWAEAAKALGAPVDGSVAIDRYNIGTTTMRLLTYAGIFWIAVQFARNRFTARRMLYALLIAEAVYAVYGLAVTLSGSETILWFPKQYYLGSVTSTFVNRNSYATYAGIGFLTVTAVITQRLLSLDLSGSRRMRLQTILRALTEREWLYIVTWFVMFTALLLANSRAGFAAACVGLLVFLWQLSRTHVIPRVATRIIGGAVVASIAIWFAVSGGALSQRFYLSAAEGVDPVRPELYRLTLNAIGDSPYLGFGLGSYEDVFSLYRTDSRAMWIRSVRAHNTYLENAVELGIPGAAVLCLAVALIAGQCFLGVTRRRRDFVYPALAFAVSAQVAVHSLVDFSLQIPAVAATYALVLGLGFAQSWSSDVPSSRAYE
jgi:O-antigen ligase